MNRDSFFAGLSGAALQSRLLTQQFIHDSRTDVLNYSAGWGHFTGIGRPYRNGDTVAVPGGSSIDLSMQFAFTSQGESDEWVSLHGLTGSPWQVYLNEVLVAERTPDGLYNAYSANVQAIEGGELWYSDDLYERPFLKMRPNRGLNTMRYFRPANSAGTFLDGVGLNIRGTLKTL